VYVVVFFFVVVVFFLVEVDDFDFVKPTFLLRLSISFLVIFLFVKPAPRTFFAPYFLII